jgi:hypothetical protein
MKLFVFIPFFSFLFFNNEADVITLPNDATQLEETFFLLDSVWTPGISNRYGLFPHDNYLHIKDGWVTVMVDEFRAKSFKGPITSVKFDDVDGKRHTTFTVRNVKMRIELRELDNQIYEVYMYKYLDSYERMFKARWIDLTKIKVSFEEEED